MHNNNKNSYPKKSKDKYRIISSDKSEISDKIPLSSVSFGILKNELATENAANELGLTAADIQDFKG